MTKNLHVDRIDWSRYALNIGVELPPGDEPPPWLEMSRDDLKMLHLLLTRQMPILSDGKLTFVPSPASSSEGLSALVRGIDSMLRWQERQVAVSK